MEPARSTLVTSVASNPVQSSDLSAVLTFLDHVKPHTFEFPSIHIPITSCGNGVIAGFEDGKVVQVTAGPQPICYELQSKTPHTAQVNSLAVSQDSQRAISGANDGRVKYWVGYAELPGNCHV